MEQLRSFVASWQREFKVKNQTGMFALFAPAVTFYSPVVDRPYVKRDEIFLILSFVIHVLEDLTYTRILYDADTRSVCMEFKSFITTPSGERIPADGIDMFRLDSNGLIEDFKVLMHEWTQHMLFAIAERASGSLVSATFAVYQVFIRPLKATMALSASMKPKLEAAKARAKAKL
jgi:hypothetical protein